MIRFTRQEARYEHADRYDRGSRYNEQHLLDVEIETQATNRFVVRFPDSDEGHVVDLVASPSGYAGECTCADHEYRETVCKHMWAVFANDAAPVVDKTDDRIPDRPRAIADGGAVTATSTSSTRPNGQAPTMGELVEEWMEDRFPIRLVDSKYYDARLTTDTGLAREGAPVQIKGTQERVKNGYDRNGNQKYTSGRLTAWRNELLELLADGGVYLIGLYHPDRDPKSEDFVTRSRWIRPEDFGEELEDHWTNGHRESKGQKGRVPWTKVLGGDSDV